MLYRLTGTIVLILLCLVPSSRAQTRLMRFDDRAAFTSASSRPVTINFESAAPAKGFGKYPAAEGLMANGASFRASGGAKFGPGMVYVPSAHYVALNPMYPAGAGAVLTWSPPNQPGNASLDVTLPRGVTAVGAELWTMQPRASTIEVTARTIDGKVQTVIVNTNRPAGSFVGFTSDADIISISFRLPKGQTGLILDNFVTGRATGTGRSSPTTAVADTSRPDESEGDKQPTRPPASQTNQPIISQTTQAPASPAKQSAAPPIENRQPAPATTGGAGRGTIAYVRGGTEIRLIEPDGTNDRRLWTHPLATADSGINELAWRPDGAELAFSSSHHSVVSRYHADIYAVRPDGTGFRKITNPPDHGELARYPKGAVQITVRNDQPIYKQSRASTGVFFVYVAGADEPQPLTLPPGSSKTLTFKSVADFGDHAQAVVAVYGQYRWIMPGVDVRAGRTVTAPAFGISGDGFELFGAFRPVWRGDGSRISYRSGACVISSAPAQPTSGEHVFQPMFAGEHPSGACAWDWGPTPALADQFIYSANSEGAGTSVHRSREGGTHPGTKLHTFNELDLQLLTDLRWLPDGSGFLYSFPDLAYEFGNIFRYDFATKRATRLTNFEGEYARAFDISPDGAWVVFERAKKWDDDKEVDLWVMRTDGRDARMLVRNGLGPSW